jgi:Tfp pilus assembly protein PilN
MINLLPPELKAEIRYSSRNAVMVRYLTLTVAVFAVLASGLVGARLYLNHQVSVANSQIATKQQQIASYGGTVADASNLGARLTAIASIQKNQAKFAELLTDLAEYMPEGTAVTSLTLTGSAAQPVQLTVLANSYQAAIGFRDGIARSPRISAADIEGIQGSPVPNSTAVNYTVTVVFAFNPGDAQ